MPQHSPAPTLSRGVYGFAMHLVFKSLFMIYVLWALIPEHWFAALGFTYFPQRYWAVTIPIFLLTLLAIFAFFIYPSLGLIMTPNCDDISTIEDQHTKYQILRSSDDVESSVPEHQCICKDLIKCKKSSFDNVVFKKFIEENAIPLKYDIPITEISKVLYLNKGVK